MIPGRTEIWKCWFLRKGENQRSRGKSSRSKGENHQQTEPAWRLRLGLNPGHIGGRRVLSPLRHSCFPIKCSNCLSVGYLWWLDPVFLKAYLSPLDFVFANSLVFIVNAL